MKKIFILTVAAVVTAISANAQKFSSGDWILNANVSELNLTHYRRFTDSLHVTDLNIAVNAGYFLSDKFAVDASLGFDFRKGNSKRPNSIFTLGAGVRYYPVGNLFARVGYIDYAGKGSDLSASVGYDLFLSERVFFEPAVVYKKTLTRGKLSILSLLLGIGIKL